MMSPGKMLLSAVVQSLSTAAAEANSRLHRDYIAAVRRLLNSTEDNLITLPPPLAISRMKINFSAHVSRQERAMGGDLLLDFGKPGNFQGEIEIQPYEHSTLKQNFTEPPPEYVADNKHDAVYENAPDYPAAFSTGPTDDTVYGAAHGNSLFDSPPAENNGGVV